MILPFSPLLSCGNFLAMWADCQLGWLLRQAVAARSATAHRDEGHGHHQPQQLPERLRARESMAAGPAGPAKPQRAESVPAWYHHLQHQHQQLVGSVELMGNCASDDGLIIPVLAHNFQLIYVFSGMMELGRLALYTFVGSCFLSRSCCQILLRGACAKGEAWQSSLALFAEFRSKQLGTNLILGTCIGDHWGRKSWHGALPTLLHTIGRLSRLVVGDQQYS